MDGDEPIASGGADYDEFEMDDDFEQIQDDTDDEATVQVNQKMRKLFDSHPECQIDYIETVLPKVNIIPEDGGATNESAEEGTGITKNILESLDANHTTFPFLTNYEKTSIIGLRSEALSRGSRPFIIVPSYMTEAREIARLELEQKRLPYIIKRPLPNGSYEYWRLADLMLI